MKLQIFSLATLLVQRGESFPPVLKTSLASHLFSVAPSSRVTCFCIAALVPLWLAAPASAGNPVHVIQLLRTGTCSGCDLGGTDLKNVNLSGADLRGANLIGADLENANLSGANLMNSNLVGVNFTGTNLNGANL
ncbi:MAG TPA: pentapeptide repeat-containing protein, partial [Leptolyngbyaceae cyanobacterium]